MINVIKEHIEYKYQIFKLAWFDVVKEYKGTVFGWTWVIIKPAITIFVYWFAFTYGLRSGSSIEGMPYIVWLISGIIPWFFMSDMLNKGIASLRKNQHLVTKIKFPISVIPTFDTISYLIPHIFLMLLFMIIYVCVYGFNIYMIQLPLYTICMALFFNALSLGFSLLAVISKDFMNLVRALTTAVFWMSGVIWNVDKIHLTWFHRLLYFNPVTFFCEGYRNVFVHNRWFFENPKSLLCICFMFVITLAFSLFVLKKTKYEVGDVI